MKRERKLFRNIIIITLILYVFYYFGGYYISKSQCIEETMRGLYVKEDNIVMEIQNGNAIRTLVVDDNVSSLSVIGTKKVGPFYHTASCSTGMKMKDDENFSIYSSYDSANGLTSFVYRNNKDIAYIELTLDNGTTTVLDDWHEDFAGAIVDTDDIYGIYRAYDENDVLIEEKE